MFILLNRNPYNVIRFQAFDNVYETYLYDDEEALHSSHASLSSKSLRKYSDHHRSQSQSDLDKFTFINTTGDCKSNANVNITMESGETFSSVLPPTPTKAMSPAHGPTSLSRLQSPQTPSINISAHNPSTCKKRFPSFTSALVNLLVHVCHSTENSWETNYSISVRIIRLLGVVLPTGISSHHFKILISMLGTPSLLAIPLLQSLKTALKLTEPSVTTIVSLDTNQAFPLSFFNFGGQGSGLYSVLGPSWFATDYQLAFWFRVEKFDE